MSGSTVEEEHVRARKALEKNGVRLVEGRRVAWRGLVTRGRP